MKRLVNDNRGAVMIEAAIYFPIIVIMVVLMVLTSLFKLEKMMTQAYMSKKAYEAQCERNQDTESNYAYWTCLDDSINNDVLTGNAIFNWGTATTRTYMCVNTGTLCPIIEYDYRRMGNPHSISLVRSNTSHTYLVSNNPKNVVYTYDDVKMMCSTTKYGENALYSKTGCNYLTYRMKQFGN